MLKEIRNGRAMHWLAIYAAAGMSAGAVSAWAADPTPAENGLMTFPNVRVISVPSIPANPSAVQAPEADGGFRAFVDPATGRRVQPTREATAALNATARGQATQAVQPRQTFVGPDGSVGIRRDKSHARNLVARVNSDGTLTMACVPGEHAAERLSGNDTDTGKRARKGELK